MTSTARQKSSLRFRGRSFLALVLTPEMPVADWLSDIDDWLARSPRFFAGKPVVLDATGLSLGRKDFAGLIEDLDKRGVRVLGIEGADPTWTGLGLPPILTGGRTTRSEDVAGEPPARPAAPTSLVVEAPVRSGQSIIHPDGDVTVVGPVASGAEIVAAGSIHIYGTLRGRALAGAYGNPRARIFCRRLEAELMAIDGRYAIAEELEHMRRKPVHAWLEGESLKVASLD